jgi:GntR family transcriptional regulator
MQPPNHFLVVEPDDELRQIIIAEIRNAVSFDVRGRAPNDLHDSSILLGAFPLSLPSRKELTRKALPEGTDFMTLQVRSVPKSLAGYLPARTDLLIGVASRWQEFLKSSKTMLVAAGFHPDSLLVRDARQPGWKQGLSTTAAVVCDCVTGTKLPKNCRAIPFPIIAEQSLAELKRLSNESPTR